MGPYAKERERLDWHVIAQTTALPPRVTISYPGDSPQAQAYYERRHIFEPSGYQYYPYSSYCGSTTVSTVLGQHWSRPQKYDQQHHISNSLRYQDPTVDGNNLFSSISESSETKKDVEIDDQFVERMANMVATSKSQKYSVHADILKKKVKVSNQNLESTTKNIKFEDLLFRNERTGLNVQGVVPGVNNANKRKLFIYKTWDSSESKWRPTKIYKAKDFRKIALGQDSPSAAAQRYFHIPLSRGGKLNIFPNLIDPKRVNRVKKEILECNFWRKYSIQGGDEPRLHFLVSAFRAVNILVS